MRNRERSRNDCGAQGTGCVTEHACCKDGIDRLETRCCRKGRESAMEGVSEDAEQQWLVLFWDITPLGVLCGKNETLAPTSCGLLVVMKLTDRKLPDRCIHRVHFRLKQDSSTHARGSHGVRPRLSDRFTLKPSTLTCPNESSLTSAFNR